MAQIQRQRAPGYPGGGTVGHIQYVTPKLLHVRFQPEKVRLVGLGFNKINPVVLWITPSGCREI